MGLSTSTPTTIRGKVITFYSFKGGVGRSMALANVAAILAQRGRRVLALDFDFEAPGLHRYFLAKESKFTRSEPGGPQDGVINLFYALRERLREQWPGGSGFGERAALERAAAMIGALLDSGDYGHRVRLKNPNVRKAPPVEMQFIAAARFDASYAERIREFDWQEFYDQYAEIFPVFAAELSRRYDYVLVDSRTGVTDIGSICTMMLPDKLVLVFSPNEQSLLGALEAGRQSVLQRKASSDPRPLPLFPLLSRVEDSEETLKRAWVERAQEGFQQLFIEVYGLESCDLETYFKLVRIPHRSFYAYGERIAAEEQAVIETGSLAGAFQRFLDCLECDNATDAQDMLERSEQEIESALPSGLENETTLIEMIRRQPENPSLHLKYVSFLVRGGRKTEALNLCDDILTRFGRRTDTPYHVAVAGALFIKGTIWGELERYEESLGAFDEVIRRYGEMSHPLILRVSVATSLHSKGGAFENLKRFDEALVAYDEVVRRFGDAIDPALREVVANALLGRGRTLSTLEKRDEALRAYDEVQRRFGDATEAPLREHVASALVNKGTTLQQIGQPGQALATFDEVLHRFGEALELPLRTQVAIALLSKGDVLNDSDRNEEAINAFDEVILRFGDASEPLLRSSVAIALAAKGEVLARLGRHRDAIAIYGEIVRRFGEAAEPPLRKQVAKALVNQGHLLDEIGQRGEASAALAEVVRRFGEASDTSIREQVALALNGTGFWQLLDAKRMWRDGDEGAARRLLLAAQATIAAARARDPDQPFILGNAGYIAFLLGEIDQARALLSDALRIGGESLRAGEIADADIHPLPQDEEFRALVRSLSVAPSPQDTTKS